MSSHDEDADADARLHVLWLKQIAAASAPAPAPDSLLREMRVTPALLADYRGHEVFLKHRALHPPACFSRFDDFRSCLIRRIADEKACEVILRNYAPCAREARKAALASGPRDAAADDDRRRLLNVRAREKETAARAGPVL